MLNESRFKVEFIKDYYKCEKWGILMKTWEIMIGFQALTALISLVSVLIFMFKKDEIV